MLGKTFRAHCYRIELIGTWEVFCLRCAKSIGTFDSDGLRQAIWLTHDRGGILCVDCRANSCLECGAELQETGVDGFQVRRNGEGLYCWFCALERMSEDEAREQVVPCLVPHISKTTAKEDRHLARGPYFQISPKSGAWAAANE